MYPFGHLAGWNFRIEFSHCWLLKMNSAKCEYPGSHCTAVKLLTAVIVKETFISKPTVRAFETRNIWARHPCWPALNLPSETQRTNKDCHQTGRSDPEDGLKIMSCFGQLWPNVDGGPHENSHCELPGHLLVRVWAVAISVSCRQLR